MADTKTKVFNVSLNGTSGVQRIEAATAEEACQKAKEESGSLRDVRNFTAKIETATSLSAPIPKLDKAPAK